MASIYDFYDVLCSVMNIKEMERDVEDLKKEVASLKKMIQNRQDTSVSNQGGESFTEAVHSNQQSQNNDHSQIVRKPNSKPAKDAFIENITLIKPLLENLSGDSYQGNKWNDLILSLNSDELISMWSKIQEKPESVIRILAAWGIKPDSCTSFYCTGNEDEMYSDLNSEKLEQGVKYNVVKKCWLLTNNDGQKTVIVKGEVRKSV